LRLLGTFDAPQGHEQERQERGAQAEERRAQAAVDLLRTVEKPAGNQSRHRQQHASPWHVRTGAEQWCGILQQPQPRQQPIAPTIRGVGVEGARRRVFRSGCRKSGQVWVRTFLNLQRQFGLCCWDLFPIQTPEQFAHGNLGYFQAACDLTVGMPPILEPFQ